MSFEVFVECFAETKQTGLPRAAVRSLFPVDESASEPDYWRVRYDDTNTCEIGVTPLANNGARLSRMYVDRPSGDMRIWDALFQILNMGFVVLVFPGGPAIVAHQGAASVITAELTEAIGQVVCVESGESILKIVHES